MKASRPKLIKYDMSLIASISYSFSLLLRFTDDTFDPEQAATIGKLKTHIFT